ncbi:amidohydrolase family protein [Sphingobium sp. SCG-1]|uniref:amidohydrolase family protein n=1 Tax=Sphingobium sp. SCG-1 TaxID=2072936 RepID=UPI0011AB7F3B|nr:amidohydrolase family protein [Sphingobium sp. SCG-1]
MLIDFHHHYLPPFLIEAFEEAGRRASLARFPEWSRDGSLALLDLIGAEMAMMSAPTPGVHLGDNGAAADLARRCNDFTAGLSVETAGRLSAFATLSLPDIDAACKEAELALNMGFLGVGVLASYGDIFLGDPLLDPLMSILDERGAMMFVHPVGHLSSSALAQPAPLWMIEYPIDTTRAALNMILAGTQDRFPNIRIILAHAGGCLPFLSVRLREMSVIDSRFAHLTPERIDRHIAGFYYDLAQASGAATFAALGVVAQPNHLLFGSDFPYCGRQAIQNMADNVSYLAGGFGRLRTNGSKLLKSASEGRAGGNVKVRGEIIA